MNEIGDLFGERPSHIARVALILRQVISLFDGAGALLAYRSGPGGYLPKPWEVKKPAVSTE